MTRISSPQNPLVKYVRSLERGRLRRAQGVYIAEGVRLVQDAAATEQRAALVLYDPESLTRSDSGSSLVGTIPLWADEWHEVDGRVMRAISQTETPPGVLAVLRLPTPPPLSRAVSGPFGVVLDGLADPGNAGTILRTAAAAGVSYVVAVEDTVDLFSPKVVRAGMGAHFRLPLYTGLRLREIAEALAGVPLIVTEMKGGESVYRYAWPDQAALVVGSEATGISDEARNRAQASVYIPMRRGVESLNASVAASLAIYAALNPTIDSAEGETAS